jgi:hypothetical protein
MTQRVFVERRREQGVALLVSVLALAQIGAITLAAIENSGRESTASGRSRASIRTLHAADAGFQLATNRLSQNPPNLALINMTVGNRTVQSRTRTQASPQPIGFVGNGSAPAGYSVNVGSGYASDVYLITITATGSNGASSEIEAKFGRLSQGAGGY